MKPLTKFLITLCVIIGYGTGAGATWGAHEALYPGSEPYTPNNSTFMSAFWPLAVPVWLGVEGGKALAEAFISETDKKEN